MKEDIKLYLALLVASNWKWLKWVILAGQLAAVFLAFCAIAFV